MFSELTRGHSRSGTYGIAAGALTFGLNFWETIASLSVTANLPVTTGLFNSVMAHAVMAVFGSLVFIYSVFFVANQRNSFHTRQ